VGAAIAARHTWIQHLPEDQRPACGPSLDFMLETFGPVKSIGRILRGSGECGKVDWTFLSFSIPEWTLAAFGAFAIWAVVLARRDGLASLVAVGVLELPHQVLEHLLELALVAAHQHGVLERVLAELLDLLEVLAQHLQLLDTGDQLARRRAPHCFGQG